MVNSINSNSGLGIQQLNKTLSGLNKTQSRITTGLKVNGPKDNSALFAIAQNLLGQSAGAAAVKTTLYSAEAIVGTAIAGGQIVGDLLTEIKGKVVQGNNPALDQVGRDAINAEVQQLVDQVNTVSSSSAFGGTNLIENGASDFAVLSGANGDTFDVGAQDFSAQGLGIDSISVATSGGAVSALSAIDNAITQASSGLANLGSSAQRIVDQSEFTTRLDNVLQAGIGNLIDADLGAESAGRAAGSVKAALGALPLAIANAGPKALLSLFPGSS
jgi:flagellin